MPATSTAIQFGVITIFIGLGTEYIGYFSVRTKNGNEAGKKGDRGGSLSDQRYRFQADLDPLFRHRHSRFYRNDPLRSFFPLDVQAGLWVFDRDRVCGLARESVPVVFTQELFRLVRQACPQDHRLAAGRVVLYDTGELCT